MTGLQGARTAPLVHHTEDAREQTSFEELREGAMRWIRRLSARTWTDHNLHDPGITMLEAGIWGLVDLLYRVDELDPGASTSLTSPDTRPPGNVPWRSLVEHMLLERFEDLVEAVSAREGDDVGGEATLSRLHELLDSIPVVRDVRAGAVSIAAGGARIATVGEDGVVRVRDLDAQASERRIQNVPGFVVSARISDDGSTVAVILADDSVLLWDVATDTPVLTTGTKALRGSPLAVSRDGQLVAFVHVDDQGRTAVTVRERGSTEPVTLLLPADEARVLAVGGDRACVAIAGSGRAVRIWHHREGHQCVEFHGHAGGVVDLAIDGAGTRVAVAAADHALWIWDIDNGSPMRVFDRSVSPICSVALSPDGSQAVWGLGDGGLRVASLDLASEDHGGMRREAIRGIEPYDGDRCRAVLCVGNASSELGVVAVHKGGTITVWRGEQDQFVAHLRLSPTTTDATTGEKNAAAGTLLRHARRQELHDAAVDLRASLDRILTTVSRDEDPAKKRAVAIADAVAQRMRVARSGTRTRAWCDGEMRWESVDPTKGIRADGNEPGGQDRLGPDSEEQAVLVAGSDAELDALELAEYGLEQRGVCQVWPPHPAQVRSVDPVTAHDLLTRLARRLGDSTRRMWAVTGAVKGLSMRGVSNVDRPYLQGAVSLLVVATDGCEAARDLEACRMAFAPSAQTRCYWGHRDIGAGEGSVVPLGIDLYFGHVRPVPIRISGALAVRPGVSLCDRKRAVDEALGDYLTTGVLPGARSDSRNEDKPVFATGWLPGQDLDSKAMEDVVRCVGGLEDVVTLRIEVIRDGKPVSDCKLLPFEVPEIEDRENPFPGLSVYCELAENDYD